MRRGLTTYCGSLSHGRLKAGPGGGPALRCLEITPNRGTAGSRIPNTVRSREPSAWAAETDGRATTKGGRRAALFFRSAALLEL